MFKILKENRIFQLIKSMKAQTLEWMKKTIQGVKVEIQSNKKIQTEGKQEMKVLGTWTGASETSLNDTIE